MGVHLAGAAMPTPDLSLLKGSCEESPSLLGLGRAYCLVCKGGIPSPSQKFEACVYSHDSSKLEALLDSIVEHPCSGSVDLT